MSDKRRKPDATGPELFALWVECGTPKYRDFAETLVQRGYYKTAATASRRVAAIASRDKWQDRKAKALDDAAMTALEEAARIDAASFLKTSKEIAHRLQYTTSEHLDPLLKMRESVRKPSPKGASVNVNINVLLQDLIERYGLTPDEAEALHADVASHLAATKVGTP